MGQEDPPEASFAEEFDDSEATYSFGQRGRFVMVRKLDGHIGVISQWWRVARYGIILVLRHP
jgi:hypothetical protein